HDRQRLLLPGLRVPRCLPRSRTQTHPNQALHAKDQRQGRALHPDRAARVGLRPALSHLNPPCRPAATLAASLQLAPAPWQPACTNTHQPPRPDRGQPVATPQLELDPAGREPTLEESHLISSINDALRALSAFEPGSDND